MTLPGWARDAKEAEDAYYKRRLKYGRFLGAVLTALAAVLLGVEYFGLLATSYIQGVTLVSLFAIFILFNLESYFVPKPQTPNYQRLGSFLYSIAENLGDDNKPAKEDLKRQVRRMRSLIGEQQPEFEERDLVFGVAVSVLKKLAEIAQRAASASQAGVQRESLPMIKQNLAILAESVFNAKTINEPSIETVTDSVLGNMQGLPVLPPIPFPKLVSTWFLSRSSRDMFFIEIVLSLLIASLGTILFRIGIFDGLILFLALVAALDITERRVVQRG